MSIALQYRSTEQLLRAARKDPEPVSGFANGTSLDDSHEVVFVVKGKRKVQQAVAALIGAGLMTTAPVIQGGGP